MDPRSFTAGNEISRFHRIRKVFASLESDDEHRYQKRDDLFDFIFHLPFGEIGTSARLRQHDLIRLIENRRNVPEADRDDQGEFVVKVKTVDNVMMIKSRMTTKMLISTPFSYTLN